MATWLFILAIIIIVFTFATIIVTVVMLTRRRSDVMPLPQNLDVPSYTGATETHFLAILSLILGILGITGILPLVGSIGAIISGRMSYDEIRKSPGRYTGEGVARAGEILGWVGVGLTVLIACIMLLGFLVFFAVRVSH